MNYKRITVTWAIIFLLVFVLINWLSKKQNPPAEPGKEEITVLMSKKEFGEGKEVSLRIQNNTQNTIEIPSSCPSQPFNVLVWNGQTYAEKTAVTKVDCSQVPAIKLEPQKSVMVSYGLWNHALFSAIGRYKIDVPVSISGKQKIFSSEEFTIEKRSALGWFWDKLFYQPIFNLLIFLATVLPLRDLGLAIIILTIIVRLILLIPSQRAIKAQKRLQEVQPKLDAIKKKYAGNQERIAQETMSIWKKEKVNPFGSCLPLIIQFPFLIAIFYVIRNGLNPDQAYMLYAPLKEIDFSVINTNFLGILDLTKINAYVLPLTVGILQFMQMKLAIPTLKKAGEPASAPQKNEMQTANKMMLYVMPVMIGLFTASVPAGVGLYWGISTVFAIGQQLVANRVKIKTTPI